MVLLITGILLLVFVGLIVGRAVVDRFWGIWDDMYWVSAILITGALFVCALTCWLLLLCHGLGNISTPNKVKTYQDRNTQIAMEVETTVNQYESSNGKTLTKLDSESDLNLYVSGYPELKSDVTIQNDLQEHTENTAQIVELSSLYTDNSETQWLISFGLFW